MPNGWGSNCLVGKHCARAAPDGLLLKHRYNKEAQLNYDVINAIVVTLASGICDGKSNLSFSSACVNFRDCPLANRRAEKTLGLIPRISSAAAGHSRTCTKILLPFAVVRIEAIPCTGL